MTTNSRVVLGFFLAPLMTPLWFIASALAFGSGPVRLGDVEVFFAITGIYAYAATLVFGVPVFFLYRSFKIKSFIFFIIGGGVIGVIMSWFMAQTYSFTYLKLHLWFAIPGVLSALVFRLITGSTPYERRRSFAEESN